MADEVNSSIAEPEPSMGLQTPFHVAASVATRKAMEEIVKNWDGSLTGQDVEAIHDLRVGTRRLRATLSVYEAAFPAKEFARIEKTMAALTDALGPARDTDVLIEHLKSVAEVAEQSRHAEKVGLETFIDYLENQRERQQKALDRAMTKVDLDQVSRDLESAIYPTSNP